MVAHYRYTVHTETGGAHIDLAQQGPGEDEWQLTRRSVLVIANREQAEKIVQELNSAVMLGQMTESADVRAVLQKLWDEARGDDHTPRVARATVAQIARLLDVPLTRS